MENIISNLNEINQRISASCKNSNRNLSDVRLLLATKTVPPERIKIALETGTTLIAENKVQELKEKYEALKNIPHTNHFIGHLQTNKIKDILKCDVVCIQSLDRIELAQKLHQSLLQKNKTIDVLIQVNTSDEASKFGITPSQTIYFIQQVAAFHTLKIKGLMTIGLFSTEEQKVRPCFQLLRRLKEEIATLEIPNVEMKELSMGMSGDLEIAIEEGATIIRVGTAVFGKRATPDSYYWNENN